MFKEYILKILAANYENKIIILDFDNIGSHYSYTKLLENYGFKITVYKDATDFRYIYECTIKGNRDKFAVIINREQYIPYDIIKSFYCAHISWNLLFPNLNMDILSLDKNIDLSLLYAAYYKYHDNMDMQENPGAYILNKAYEKENAETYINDLKIELISIMSTDALDYYNWIDVAIKKGRAEYIAARSHLNIDFTFIDEKFKDFILKGYTVLSSIVNKSSAVMVNRVLDFITKNKEKTAIIVLDGMSIFDFNIISSEFNDIEYDEDFIYALVPTTTAISRQCLLSGKYPVELTRPFDLSREEKEFKSKAQSLGYLENQIKYARGFDIDIGPNIKCLSIILNDIDDLVHSQTQGRVGMYNDVSLFAKSGKLQKLIKNLFGKGFNVYLTSDHGNTLCKGLGSVRGLGIEVETKSKRMLVLKDYANNIEFINKYNLLEYPGYYMDKKYQYLICNTGTSLDIKDSIVMTHGGISIDEVIVPLIKIKAV